MSSVGVVDVVLFVVAVDVAELYLAEKADVDGMSFGYYYCYDGGGDDRPEAPQTLDCCCTSQRHDPP